MASQRGDRARRQGRVFPVPRSYPRQSTRGSQRTGEQNGAVHSRQFALPRAPAGLHVEKVIVEAVVAGGVRLGALPAVPEKSQCGEDDLDRRRARDEAALDRDRIRRQGEPGGGNAGGPIGRGLVEHQSIVRIGLVQKVAEGVALKRFQLGIDRRFVGVHRVSDPRNPERSFAMFSCSSTSWGCARSRLNTWHVKPLPVRPNREGIVRALRDRVSRPRSDRRRRLRLLRGSPALASRR